MIGYLFFVLATLAVIWWLDQREKKFRLLPGKVLAWLRKDGLEWLKRQRPAAFLRRHYVPLVFAVVIGTLVWVSGDWITRIPGLIRTLFDEIELFSSRPSRPDHEAIRNVAYAIGTLIAGMSLFATIPFQMIRMWINERQTTTIEQGHVTDRLTKAIEKLGAEKTIIRTEIGEDGKPIKIEETKPNIEVRLGAIYALERIAQDSERDHIPVMETLCAYLRENSVGHKPTEGERTRYPPVDIKSTLEVLSRLRTDHLKSDTRKDHFLDLTRVDLRNRQLVGLNLNRIDLSESKLDGAIIADSRLEHAQLISTQLTNAMLTNVHMECARLVMTQLQGAYMNNVFLKDAAMFEVRFNSTTLRNTDFNSASFKDIRFVHTSLKATDFTGANGLSPESLKTAFGVKCGIGRTILPDGMVAPSHWHEAEEAYEESDAAIHAYGEAYQTWLKTQPSPKPGA